MDSLSVKEVAERLKVHISTIRRLLQSGRLEGFKVGRQWRVPETALQSLGNGGTDVTVEQVLNLVQADRCPVCGSLLRESSDDHTTAAVPSWGWSEDILECSFCEFTIAENASSNPQELKSNVERYLERLSRQADEGRKACAVLSRRSNNLSRL
ncbi:MAG: helix-turn-helix domain-containing protein [Armatimonadetes bacterium]|nr:helix-turn-helix domain-containing protein [Armatimonadota bacterium]